MIPLANGCSCSEPTIFPANWKSGGASLLKKTWYIQYYFRDPLFEEKYPYGKLVRIKGLQCYKTLELRRHFAQKTLDEQLTFLQDWHYNPITGQKVAPIVYEPPVYEISPHTPWIDALDTIYKRLKVSKDTKKDMKVVVNNMRMAANQLRYDGMAIGDIRRKHIKICLEHLQATIPTMPVKEGRPPRTWGAPSYNRHRSLLMSMFKELLELETVEADPVSSIKIQDELPAEREVLSPKERKLVSDYLKQNHYPFWRFAQIFLNSGGRVSELMRLQVKDVDLSGQTYKTVVKKGRKARRQARTIKDIALPYWAELINSANPDDYIFSKGLEPGPAGIQPYQITYRWERHVKNNTTLQKANDGKKITADFYALKHLHSDETVEQATMQIASEIALQLAASQNGHTSTAMVRKIYAVNQEGREHERIKKLGNEF